jgi:3-oxoacyl-[acyl-carrier-protein] synthase-3
MARRSFIRGTGGYLPAKVLTNDDLSAMVDTSDEWIQERTGIKRRHVAAEGELTSDIATAAARSALEAAGVPVSDVDLIVLATTTPDQTFPATATAVQAKLGMTGGAAFDVQAVCSGFLFALATADSMLRQGTLQYGDCHWRGDFHAHSRLVGPWHLCLVRGWRRRGCVAG